MPTLPDPDGYLFRDPTKEHHAPTWDDIDAGTWGMTYGSEAYQERMRLFDEYLAAGLDRRKFAAYIEELSRQDEDVVKVFALKRAALRAAEAVRKATGASVDLPIRAPQPSVYVPPTRFVLTPEEKAESWENDSEPNREPPTRGPAASEIKATQWSEAHSIPRHSRQRPSQTRAGRRRRYIRAIAAKENISIKKAEQLHPPRRKESQPCH
jgi:hypothetical protein